MAGRRSRLGLLCPMGNLGIDAAAGRDADIRAAAGTDAGAAATLVGVRVGSRRTIMTSALPAPQARVSSRPATGSASKPPSKPKLELDTGGGSLGALGDFESDSLGSIGTSSGGGSVGTSGGGGGGPGGSSSGGVLMGMGNSPAQSPEAVLDTEMVNKIVDHAIHRVPLLEKASLLTSWSGVRPLTADGRPIFGRISGVDGLLLNCGWGGMGIIQAPVAGQLMAELVSNGQTSTFETEDLQLSRFMN